MPGILSGDTGGEIGAADGSQTVTSDSIRYIYPPYVVKGMRWSERELTSDLLVTVINADRPSSLTAMGLGEVFDHQAGLFMKRAGGPGSPSLLSIRGSTSDQVLILLNGRRLNTAQGGGFDLSMLSPWEVSRIEVYREANSARWGSDSMGGVVNIVTRNHGGERLRLRTLGGSYGAKSLSLSGALGDEAPLDFGGSYRASDDDFYFTDPRRGGERRRANADFRGRSFYGDLYVPVAGDDVIGFYLSTGRDERGAPGPIEFPTPQARLDDGRIFLQGGVADTVGITHLSVGAGVRRMDRRYRNPDPILWADDRHINTGATVSADLSRGISSGGMVETGGSYDRDILSSTTDGHQDRGSVAAYASILFPIGRTRDHGSPRSTLGSGLRFERTEGYRARVLPFVSSKFILLDERLVLRGSLGKKYRTPSFDELFWPLTSGAEGNPELRPERSTNVEFSGSTYLLDRRLRIRNDYFLRELTDLIEWTPGARGIWRPSNVGRAREEGLELEGTYTGKIIDALPPVLIEISHSLILATDQGDDPLTHGKRLVRRPGSLSSAQIEVFPGDVLSMGLSWSRVGRRYLTKTNTKWADGYDVIDMNASYSCWRRVRVSVSISNLLNHNYYDIEEFPVPGRRIDVGLDLKML